MSTVYLRDERDMIEDALRSYAGNPLFLGRPTDEGVLRRLQFGQSCLGTTCLITDNDSDRSSDAIFIIVGRVAHRRFNVSSDGGWCGPTEMSFSNIKLGFIVQRPRAQDVIGNFNMSNMFSCSIRSLRAICGSISQSGQSIRTPCDLDQLTRSEIIYATHPLIRKCELIQPVHMHVLT